MARALLDINVVIALLDQAHLFHHPEWCDSHHGPAGPSKPSARHPSHAFWPAPISLLDQDLIRWMNLLGPRQITAAYLLALATTRDGRFATFDQRLGLDLVPAATDADLCRSPVGGERAGT